MSFIVKIKYLMYKNKLTCKDIFINFIIALLVMPLVAMCIVVSWSFSIYVIKLLISY